jgi:apolipoprotein N-acyltransferase
MRRTAKRYRFAAEAPILTRLWALAGWRADAAAALLGIVAALALPPLTLAPLLAASIPGLLALIDGAPTRRAAFRRGMAFGTAHHLAGLYWVTNAILVQAADFWWAVPIGVPLLAAVLAVFIALPCAAARAVLPGWPRVLMLAGAWVFGDLARQFVLTGFPWNPLGSAMEMPGTLGLAFMQPAAWVSVHGLTFLAVLLAGALSLSRRARLGALAALLLWGTAGLIRLQLPASPAPDLTAVIVQGNVPETEHRDHWNDRAWIDRIFERHLALTRAGVLQAAGHPSVVVWPETASPWWLEEDAPARRMVAEAAGPALATLAGTPRMDQHKQPHNSLVAVMPDASIGAVYDKFHLVPYGEYFPSYLPIRLGEQGWVPGPGLRTLHVPGLPPIGPLICFEAAFPAQVALESDRPGMLLNITNDSWFGNSAGPRQHLAAARMRAVEEGLPLVRAANTGISAIINAHGMVVAQLGLGKQGTLVGMIPGVMPPTLESRLGLAAPGLLAIFSCACGMLISRRRGNASFLPHEVQKKRISSLKAER